MAGQKIDGLKLQKGKVFILMLSIVALVGMTLDFVGGFFSFSSSGVSFWFPTDPYSILRYLVSAMDVAALVLILLAVVRLCKTETMSNLLPTGYLLIAITPLANNLISFIMYDFFNLQSLLYSLLVFVAFLLAAISAWRGFSMKVVVIVFASLVGVLYLVFFITYLASDFRWIIENAPLVAILDLGYYLAWLAMAALPILVVLFCRRADWWQPSNPMPGEYGFAATGNPEQDLRQLQYNLQMGYITPEQYAAQRAHILNQL